MEFVNFELAKKLKEKGFTCNYPFAMYNELGDFHPLYTSCEETLVNCMFGNRGYYDYDDFDEADCIAPTISQVLDWFRKEKELFIDIYICIIIVTCGRFITPKFMMQISLKKVKNIQK